MPDRLDFPDTFMSDYDFLFLPNDFNLTVKSVTSTDHRFQVAIIPELDNLTA